jgi:uncharacterized protein
MSGYPKYLTDASLAKLAKWLRLSGYDTAVFTGEAGRKMLRLAEAEKRIVLTRRQDMLERQYSGELYVVKSKDTASQLKEIITRYSLTILKQNMFRICVTCNEELFAVRKDEVRDSVPPYVFANYNEYNKCPHCLRIYWAGTHQRNALQFLEKIAIKPQ